MFSSSIIIIDPLCMRPEFIEMYLLALLLARNSIFWIFIDGIIPLWHDVAKF